MLCPVRFLVLMAPLVLFAPSCDPKPAPSLAPADAAGAGADAPARPAPPLPWKAAAIAHGGLGSAPQVVDGCRAAVDAALRELEQSGDPVEAAVAGVVVLEDDPRFNAGTGSVVRIDGHTVQMDAAVMRSGGRFGAVAGVEEVKNPVRVARAVMDTPHLVLAGDGATRFARTLGMAPYDPRTTQAMARVKKTQAKLLANDPSLDTEWNTFDWRAHWNFPLSLEEAGLAVDAGLGDGGAMEPSDAPAGHDTVGVAVRASDGRFGVALSTGGTSITLRGRVGDVPILGAGLYASTYGAAACTGTGERVIEHGTARKVSDWLAAGATAQQAADRAVQEVGVRDLGLIVIDPTTLAAGVGPPGMAWAGRTAGSTEWEGPVPRPPGGGASR
jgi:L-asparaginase / beta-aspartyl-peptidase